MYLILLAAAVELYICYINLFIWYAWLPRHYSLDEYPTKIILFWNCARNISRKRIICCVYPPV